MAVNQEPSSAQPQQPPQRPARQSDSAIGDGAVAPVVTGRYQFRTAAYIWFATGVIELFLGGDFILRILAASQSSAFVGFVYSVGGLFGAPFHGIWPAASNQGSYLDPALLAAMVVYGLLAWGIVTLIKIVSAPKGTKPAV